MSWQKESDCVTKDLCGRFLAEVDHMAKESLVIENEVLFSLL